MYIAHDVTALRICNNISRYNNYISKYMLQISSGQRINSAADDPAGLAISEKMRSQIRGLNMASRNAQDAISLFQTAEGALNETHSILQRIRELVVQASNGTYNDNNRKNIQDEISQLLNEVNSISKNTTFNTTNLLDGSLGKDTNKGLNFQTGANAGQSQTAFIENMGTSGLGLDDFNIIGKSETEISSMLDKVDTAIEKVSDQRTTLGVNINVYERRIDYLDNAALNLEEAESRIRDADIAKSMMELAKYQILLQVSMALLAQANQNRQNMVSLLFDSFKTKN
jgi:flagellin